ncbi:hypothetical protein GCM10023142_23610 [Anaerocolumna aminovalerica]|jgi:hypothetical protein|uniref:Uncharacterized protein n=1 Tax=Anaerocolumna aminovalerica TaxID=1527 RepID=A0A1I5GL01_9FIRM|nr:hypothetical protein [Anaerocolumna aminovalerica]MBU5333315.1 hypothetical protein [Anaerocolumna aminovalerica]MDU6262896.1 hypothetical protein [Anaerocolumna aminovalerica]SFO36600.1 hypothetical protein SAMN04489757_12045 [Anaerocolumna aminovalerica]
MENKLYDDYKIAHISTNEIDKIDELQESIKNSSNKDVVLIAYEPKEETKG